MINPDDIDRIFRRIERMMESIDNSYYDGDYQIEDTHYDEQKDIFDDEECIYVTIDLGYNPESVDAKVLKRGDAHYLYLKIDKRMKTFKLPTHAHGSLDVNTNNGILDIVIHKYESKEEKRLE